MTQNSNSLINNSEENFLKKQSKSKQEKIENFKKIIDDIESIDDKKKSLWKEIYENALEDRQNAQMMFRKLVFIVEDKSAEHAVHSRTIASFIERMNKSNDQFIKLADLIAKSQEQNDSIDPDAIFEKIGNN